MDPDSGSGFCQIKGSLLHSETVLTVGTSEPESHPIVCAVTPRDHVPTVDHFSTGEALELELALRTNIPFHSTTCGISSYKTLFTDGSDSDVHICLCGW